MPQYGFASNKGYGSQAHIEAIQKYGPPLFTGVLLSIMCWENKNDRRKRERLQKRAGIQYEEEAVRYLKDQGYRILCRNFSCRQGEIDIVAKEGCYLCFVEVKYRGTARWGDSSLQWIFGNSSGYPEPPCIISPDTDMGQRHPAALMWWG